MGIKAYVEPKGPWQLMQQKQRNSGACTFKTQAVHYGGGLLIFFLSSLCFIVDTLIPFWALKKKKQKGGNTATESQLRFPGQWCLLNKIHGRLGAKMEVKCLKRIRRIF